MKKEDLLALAKNPNLIPGIYNYCDRWCERCSFTSRCLTYLSEQADRAGREDEEMDDEAIFEKMRESLELAQSMIEDMAEEQGIDINFTQEELNESLTEQELGRMEIESTELSEIAHEYMMHSHQWLLRSNEILKEKETELNNAMSMGLPGLDPQEVAKKIIYAWETLQWYSPQIYIKLQRAQHGKDDEPILDDDDNPYPSDSDGSAKVALIGMDNSIEAWKTLMPIFPEQEGDILLSLSMLERIRTLTEQEFPGARSFKRAGFDDH